MKKVLDIVIFVLLCIWQLPQAVIGGLVLLCMGKAKVIAKRHYCYCFQVENLKEWYMMGVSFGPIVIVNKTLAKYPEYIAHELDGHTVDSKIFGPLYLFIIGIPSGLNALFNFSKVYDNFYTEKWANKHAGLVVNHYGRLEFEKKEEVQE